MNRGSTGSPRRIRDVERSRTHVITAVCDTFRSTSHSRWTKLPALPPSPVSLEAYSFSEKMSEKCRAFAAFTRLKGTGESTVTGIVAPMIECLSGPEYLGVLQHHFLT